MSKPLERIARRVAARNGKANGATAGNTGTQPDTKFGPELVRASDVTMEKIPWLCPGRIPLGRGTLVAGRGGLGKTLLLCDMAATVSRGGYWPDGSKSPLGDVLFLSAEDDPADTLVPRGVAAGMNRSRVYFLRGAVADAPDGKKVRKSIDLKYGMDVIADAVARLQELKLVIVDPVGSYLGRGTDSHRDNEVRDALDGIARLAADKQFAVVFVAHVNKSSLNAFADDAILGSRAFSTFARATHHLLADPADKNRRLLMPGKCNLAMAPAGLAYTIEQVEVEGAGQQPRVVWCPDAVEGDANDFVSGGGRIGGAGGRGSSERKEAGDFLHTLLKNGPVPVKDIEREMKDASLSWATVRRAKDELGVVAKRLPGGVGEKRPWFWGVGSGWEPPTVDAHQDDTTLISQASEHLRGKQGQKQGETPEFCVDAHPEEASEHLRESEALSQRRCSLATGTEHLRENEGDTSIPTVDAQLVCEIGPATAPPAWVDEGEFHSLLRSTGLGWPDVLEWLNRGPCQDDPYRPDADFFGVLTDHRKASTEWLTTMVNHQKGAA